MEIDHAGSRGCDVLPDYGIHAFVTEGFGIGVALDFGIGAAVDFGIGVALDCETGVAAVDFDYNGLYEPDCAGLATHHDDGHGIRHFFACDDREVAVNDDERLRLYRLFPLP